MGTCRIFAHTPRRFMNSDVQLCADQSIGRSVGRLSRRVATSWSLRDLEIACSQLDARVSDGVSLVPKSNPRSLNRNDIESISLAD